MRQQYFLKYIRVWLVSFYWVYHCHVTLGPVQVMHWQVLIFLQNYSLNKRVNSKYLSPFASDFYDNCILFDLQAALYVSLCLLFLFPLTSRTVSISWIDSGRLGSWSAWTLTTYNLYCWRSTHWNGDVWTELYFGKSGNIVRWRYSRGCDDWGSYAPRPAIPHQAVVFDLVPTSNPSLCQLACWLLTKNRMSIFN